MATTLLPSDEYRELMAAFLSPQGALLSQIATLTRAAEKLTAAVNDVTGSVNPDDATWADVSRLAHLVDRVKMADLD